MKSKHIISRIQDKQLVSRFLVVGSGAFTLNYLILELSMVTFHLDKTVAEIFAMFLTVNLSFLAHDKWTYIVDMSHFNSRQRVRYLTYMLSNSSGSVVTIVLFTILAQNLSNLVALALAALVAMCWNFAMNLIIWKQKGTST